MSAHIDLYMGVCVQLTHAYICNIKHSMDQYTFLFGEKTTLVS